MDSGDQQIEDAGNQVELSQKLGVDWKAMADKQNVTMQFLKESELRQVDGKHGPSMLAFFNKKLDINRFFIEDSEGATGTQQNEGNDMPKVETGGGMRDGNDEVSDPFEDDLNDALCVYVSGDSNQDLLQKNKHVIMFYVDLENEEIVDKAAAGKQIEEDAGGEQAQES